MSGTAPLAPTGHAELGASIAKRWMSCPGSVRLAATCPVPPTTPYAAEGTAAHALAALALSKGVDPALYVGLEMEGVEVTEEMAEYVKVYTDFCCGLRREALSEWIEHRFTLQKLNPPGPMFGTADFVLYNSDGRLTTPRTLHVVDLKYGQGVVVEAEGNPQLKYYALGAVLSLPRGLVVEKVVMTIVQPRAVHARGAIRSATIELTDLIDFGGDLVTAARATLEPDAPLSAGAHCRFCPASGICPAQRNQAQAIARTEFSDMPLALPPRPETLTAEQLARTLELLPILDDWIGSVRAHAIAKLERGELVDGMKLVAKRATRRWADELAVAAMCEGYGLNPSDYEISKLKSPAQIEKLLDRSEWPLLNTKVVKVSSGYSMVPETDPRPALVLRAGDEFPLLPGGTEQ